ncbi:hypothetical protein ABZT49_31780 [Methylobacterium sp. EM32]|uniref:hypothetical protein n=1 Tax=Methylobacterium sp. EM32 TaxID=3163481 RepID=UPI0033AC8048
MGKKTRRRRGDHALLILTAPRYGIGEIDPPARHFVIPGTMLAIDLSPDADRVLSEDGERELREALTDRRGC